MSTIVREKTSEMSYWGLEIVCISTIARVYDKETFSHFAFSQGLALGGSGRCL